MWFICPLYIAHVNGKFWSFSAESETQLLYVYLMEKARVVSAGGPVQRQLSQWCSPTSRSGKRGCQLRFWPVTPCCTPLCQFGGRGGEETVRNSPFGLFRAWPEVEMTLRYILKVRTVTLLQRMELWAEPSQISLLVYNGLGIEMLSVSLLRRFPLKFITKKQMTCTLWFVARSFCYQMAQISCRYWTLPSSPHILAPIAILWLHMAFPGELHDGLS